MRRCNAILLLGLLLWIEPASAQKLKVQPLKVSIHESVAFTLNQNTVENILEAASNILQQHGCNVGFKLNGPVTTFTSAPADITDASTLEAVHRVPADVKVVRSINFCVGKFHEEGLWGCAWRPKGRQKTVIVTPLFGVGVEPVLWAHEFGHTTGLQHRTGEYGLTLMTPCGLEAFNQHVNKNECRHFLAGPVQHYPPGLGPACPNSSAGRRTD